MDRRKFLVRSAGTAVAVLAGAVGCSSGSGNSGSSHVKNATAITQVFGDGQKLTSVALEYDTEIKNAGLSTSDFSVSGRKITKVYANTTAATASKGTDGKYVILELDPDDDNAMVNPGAAAAMSQMGGGSGAPSGTPSGAPSGGGMGGPPSGAPSGAPSAGGMGGPPSGAPGGGGGGQQAKSVKTASATVVQKADITTADGSSYAAGSSEIKTTKADNLIVDDFQQFSFKDPENGNTLKYNLYIPKGYDSEGDESYPLVLFMHDAAVLSSDPLTTLTQGLGAVSWASPEDQAKRPAFVLAPQYDTTVVDDHGSYTITNWLDTTVRLLEKVTGSYKVDEKRLYATGQSMGAIMTIIINFQHPDLLAASFIVDGQWDSSKVKPLADQNLWFVAAHGDASAYAGQNKIAKVLEGEGAKITTATWDGKSTQAEFAADVKAMTARGTAINHTIFKKGTVVPEGQEETSLNNHLNSWRVAYTIEGIRDWVFQHSK
ncbi:hypothetical protein [Streptomyces sp. enrichment culture]|uniref:hypothetical protein n=1 Tax=Streptomyces sp. enrichment culture TaxID=1795815 RepID=UPI003F5694CB